jgi:hypothetical protein
LVKIDRCGAQFCLAGFPKPQTQEFGMSIGGPRLQRQDASRNLKALTETSTPTQTTQTGQTGQTGEVSKPPLTPQTGQRDLKQPSETTYTQASTTTTPTDRPAVTTQQASEKVDRAKVKQQPKGIGDRIAQAKAKRTAKARLKEVKPKNPEQMLEGMRSRLPGLQQAHLQAKGEMVDFQKKMESGQVPKNPQTQAEMKELEKRYFNTLTVYGALDGAEKSLSANGKLQKNQLDNVPNLMTLADIQTRLPELRKANAQATAQMMDMERRSKAGEPMPQGFNKAELEKRYYDTRMALGALTTTEDRLIKGDALKPAEKQTIDGLMQRTDVQTRLPGMQQVHAQAKGEMVDFQKKMDSGQVPKNPQTQAEMKELEKRYFNTLTVVGALDGMNRTLAAGQPLNQEQQASFGNVKLLADIQTHLPELRKASAQATAQMMDMERRSKAGEPMPQGFNKAELEKRYYDTRMALGALTTTEDRLIKGNAPLSSSELQTLQGLLRT